MNNKMPKSCQENWLELLPKDLVRFCNLHQKKLNKEKKNLMNWYRCFMLRKRTTLIKGIQIG
jgi:hypothetical protein